MVKVFRYRYGLTQINGYLSNRLHNWDGKRFDKNGYPVAFCGARCYPRDFGIRNNSETCKDCFK